MIATLPILYSFRRCPYAMRARMAIRYSSVEVELREVVLKNKPQAMLDVSPKATVPVLVLTDGTVIDESRDIMLWAVAQNDPDNWFIKSDNFKSRFEKLIQTNDGPFKQHLDHYKYADRYPEHPAGYYRKQGETFLGELNSLLEDNRYLFANQLSLIDIALFPFIRQFAFVDKDWFDRCNYPQLRNWLDSLLSLPLFTDIMRKYPAWQPGDKTRLF